jgi:methyl-accepting chemotaxis protein
MNRIITSSVILMLILAAIGVALYFIIPEDAGKMLNLLSNARADLAAVQNVPGSAVDSIVAAQSALQELTGKIHKSKLLILAFLSFGGFLYIVATFFVYRSFLEGIKKGVDFAAAVAQGNLSKRIYILSNDEVGQLSDSLNRMSVNLRFMLDQVKLSVVELSNLITQNYKISEFVTRGEALQTRSFNEMAQSLKNLDNSIHGVSENIESVYALTQKTYDNANAGKETLNRMLSEMEEIQKSSEKVREILSIMNDITEKSNLLALNASLSVVQTRGGETSNPASVIAPEIRKLSERISDSARNIEKIISANTETIRKASEATTDVNKSFNQIRNDIEEIVHLNNQAKESVADELRESKQIIALKDRVSMISEENMRQINELVSFTNTLSRQVENLQQLISHFRVQEEE